MNATAYVVAFRAAAARARRDPGLLAVRVGFYLVILTVFAGLWRATTAAAGGEVTGYDFREVLWYLMATEAAVVSLEPRLIEEIGTDIGSGAVTVEMLRPTSVVGLRLATVFGEAVTRLLVTVVVGGAFVWLVAGPPPSAVGLALAFPSLLIAVAANLALQHAFAATAFWLLDAKAAWFLYQKLVFLLGGMLLPLQVFPEGLQRVAFALPFWPMAYAPGRLASGHVEPWLLLGQAAWTFALTGLAMWCFSLGERRLQVNGG
jgi:ABC-2 type transport system permease protein